MCICTNMDFFKSFVLFSSVDKLTKASNKSIKSTYLVQFCYNPTVHILNQQMTR